MKSFLSLLNPYRKALGLLTMIVLGLLLPQFHVLAGGIQYLVMLMLFFAFLDIDFQPRAFQGRMIWAALANIPVAFLAYFLLRPFDLTLALAAFVTAIAPTGIATPVVIGFIQGRVEYVVGAMLVSNIAVALALPLALPRVVGQAAQITTWQVLAPVTATMFIPLILALLSQRLPQGAQSILRRGKSSSFAIWMFALFVMCAKAADFLRHNAADSLPMIFSIALVSLAICIVNFSLGAALGGSSHRQEASQALGQKNNSFMVWVALTFINPLAAMGPTFYILYHNVYNSWLMYRFEQRLKSSAESDGG